MPPNSVLLYKLLWHPDDIEDGTIKPTAFRSSDLSGDPDAHVSVDRGDCASRDCMERTAASQAAKANGLTIHRLAASIGRMPCGEVRSIEYDGQKAVEVQAFPLDDNRAHCGICNISGTKSRSYLNEVRGKLARLATPAVTFDEAYSNQPDDPHRTGDRA